MARLGLAIYRTEADYRQALYMQGQDTLVIWAATVSRDRQQVGAFGSIELPLGGEAKFIGAESVAFPTCAPASTPTSSARRSLARSY
jgi:hypothetical protein